MGPAEHVEEVGVGHGERVARQVRLGLRASWRRGRSASRASGSRLLFDGLVRPAEQRAEGLVDLAGDEVQPLLDAVAREGPGRGHQPRPGLEVGDVLSDDGALGEDRPVVELGAPARTPSGSRRSSRSRPASCARGCRRGPARTVRPPRCSRDVRVQRTGARAEVELHFDSFVFVGERTPRGGSMPPRPTPSRPSEKRTLAPMARAMSAPTSARTTVATTG